MSDKLIYADDNNFDQNIAEGVSLVDFYADWCGPCRMITPIMDSLASEYQGRAKIVKVNVDEAQRVSEKYNVTAIPTIIMFVDGEEVKRLVGVHDKETFQTLLNAAF
jgi:thioredoxin 1